jgi:hypothetical protein
LRWGTLDPILRAALDDAVRSDISSELRKKTAGVGDSDGVVKKLGMVIHARKALLEFCDYLEANGTRALEEAIEVKATGFETPPSDPVDAGVPAAGVEDEKPEGGVPVGSGGL